MKRRELYLEEKDTIHGVFSYNALDTGETSGEDTIPDLISPRIEDIVMNKLIENKLHQCLAKLTKEEQELIFALYFQNKSQHQYAKETGIPQMTICSRKDKIITKLKKLMEK
jgi:RNA polymerase sigma factor (sigma-70 family)